MLKTIYLFVLMLTLQACGGGDDTPTQPNYIVLEPSVMRDRLISDIDALIKNGLTTRVFSEPEKYSIKLADIKLSQTPPHRKLLRIESEQDCQENTCMMVMFIEKDNKNIITEIIFGYDLTLQPEITLGHQSFTLKAYGQEQYWRWIEDSDQGDRYDIVGTRPLQPQ